jgi:Fe2+ transport system protein B|tara:strand:+ start:282 stop:476 length:195 start_codon:yes stop_codon:yes gene_type:complete
MLKAELEAKVKELEAQIEDNIKNAKQAISQLYPKSYGDVRVHHYNKVIAHCRDIAGIPEPKENE